MNRAETAELLSLAASYDRRTIGEADVHAWHAALGHYEFDDCRDALIEHYRSSTEWVLPAHIRRVVVSRNNTRSGPLELPANAVPMPDYVRQAWAEFRSNRRKYEIRTEEGT
jgi:hypothetical protein